MKQGAHFWVIAPFCWLFYCFFQPIRFERDYEQQRIIKRIIPMLRLLLPLFLLSYLLALLVQLGFFLKTAGFLAWQNVAVLNFSFVASLCVSAGFALLGVLIGCCVGVGFGIALGSALAVALGVALGAVDSVIAGQEDVIGIVFGVTLGVTLGIILGARWKITPGLLLGGGWAIIGYLLSPAPPFQEHLFSAAVFGVATTFSYLVGYYRLPLYLISGPSGIRMYARSIKRPQDVFTYLQTSALLWDECIYLPLPGLKATLSLAAKLNLEKTLDEIAFIRAERPQQISRLRTLSLESALIHSIQPLNNLCAIASCSPLITRFLEQKLGFIDPQCIPPLIRLNDVAQSAHQYCIPESWQARRYALQSMLESLEKINVAGNFKNVAFRKEIVELVNKWHELVQRQQESLERVLAHKEKIENPFVTGPPLSTGSSLFVGRDDLVSQLQEALSRGNSRPTFLLYGERRMGKTSTLKQLPTRLGKRYLSILYNLQSTGILSSTAAFLNTIAQEIYTELTAQGMDIRKSPELADLLAEGQRNEAAIYHIFDTWLEGVEDMLKREDCTLLLIFDEFEKLGQAERNKQLNLDALLDWFRDISQNRPQLALLFCGAETLDEIKERSPRPLTNIQFLRMKFLLPREARRLIVNPVPTFPGEDIFGQEVVTKIIEVTGGHPFLVQAICDELINDLNEDIRYPAQIKDVLDAVNEVMESWGPGYFQDLWGRTSREQRRCLIALKDLGRASFLQIVQRSQLEKRVAWHALEKLKERDLIVGESSTFYHIAAPIFSEWVERNRYNL